MNKYSKTLATVLALSQISVTAFAINTDTAVTGYDFDRGAFHIEGESTYANQPVKLEVLKRNTTFDAVGSTDDYLYIGQAFSDDDKIYSFDVEVEDIGVFSYRVSELGGDVYSSGFATYTDETVQAALEEYIANENKTTADLEKLIGDYYPALGVDINMFNKPDADAKEEMLNKINLGVYEDTESFIKAVSYGVAEAVVFCSDESDKVMYTESLATVLGLNEEKFFEDYKLLTAEEKKEIIANVEKGIPYDTYAKNLENAFVIYSVDTALWNAVADVMDKYLDCNASTLFTSVSDKAEKAAVTELKEAIDDGTITKAEDMYSYLKKSIPDDDSSSSGSGGGSGSGGSRGGGGSYKAPVSTPVVEQVITTENSSEKYFADTKDVAWAEPAIEYLYKKGVINGKGENIFAPNDSVTREEFVKMIILAFGFEPSHNDGVFEDVPADAWYCPYVTAAYENGIVKGTGTTVFGTGSLIKRQDMAQMLYNILEKSGVAVAEAGELSYADKDEISDYAQNAIGVLSAMGCLNGDDSGRVLPHKNSTRAEAAKLIYSVVSAINQ